MKPCQLLCHLIKQVITYFNLPPEGGHVTSVCWAGQYVLTKCTWQKKQNQSVKILLFILLFNITSHFYVKSVLICFIGTQTGLQVQVILLQCCILTTIPLFISCQNYCYHCTIYCIHKYSPLQRWFNWISNYSPSLTWKLNPKGWGPSCVRAEGCINGLPSCLNHCAWPRAWPEPGSPLSVSSLPCL